MRPSTRILLTTSVLGTLVVISPVALAPAAHAGLEDDPSIKTICSIANQAADDPIVFPGQPGASHFHDFFGNTAVDAFATTQTMSQAATTCDISEDLSAYWSPSLLVNGVRQVPDHISAYYRVSGADPTLVQPFPFGLRMIAGDARATAPQGVLVTSWICLADDSGSERSAPGETVPTCGPGQHVGLRVEFPECWDGVNLDSADHKSHMKYISRPSETCPASHPVLVPQLHQIVHFEGLFGGTGYALSSGGQFSGHADFINLWDPERLAELVVACLNSGAICRDPNPRVAGAEAREGGNLHFLVSLEEPNAVDVTVDYATATTGTATSGADYVPTAGAITIPAGRLSVDVAVPTIEDGVAEADEMLHLEIFNPTTGVLLSKATGQIDDDDSPPRIYAVDATIAEGLGMTRSLVCELVLSEPSEARITVDYSTRNGTASAPSDYTSASGTVQFAPGVTSRPVRITVNPDNVFTEGTETFFLDLTNATMSTIGDGVGTLSVTDPATVPRLNVGDATVAEGDVASVAVTLDVPPSQPVTVDYTTVAGSAAAGTDFVSKTGTVTIPPGATSATVNLATVEDSGSEGGESFDVQFSNMTGGTIIDGKARVSITDDDTMPQLRISDATVIEPSVGTRALRFTVTLSSSSGQSVSVNWTTANGTAVAPLDYLAASGTLRLSPGTTSKTVTITVNADQSTEPDETMQVGLSAPVGAVIADNTGAGTIT